MRLTVTVREFQPNDLEACLHLFRETVHTINAKHYTPSQLEVWAPEDRNKEDFLKRMINNLTYVAEYKNKIVGFAGATQAGYFDLLYVDKDFQSKGIAVALIKKLLLRAKELNIKKAWAEVSITAKPFCENFGMRVCKQQVKKIRGETFVYYLMEIEL